MSRPRTQDGGAWQREPGAGLPWWRGQSLPLGAGLCACGVWLCPPTLSPSRHLPAGSNLPPGSRPQQSQAPTAALLRFAHSGLTLPRKGPQSTPSLPAWHPGFGSCSIMGEGGFLGDREGSTSFGFPKGSRRVPSDRLLVYLQEGRKTTVWQTPVTSSRPFTLCPHQPPPAPEPCPNSQPWCP